MPDFKVHRLGCGSATPTAKHKPSCQVIETRGKLFMIDCGEGAQLEFRRQGLKFSRLNHIFISHMHGDHFLGLPGLLSTMALHQKEGEVTVHIHPEGAVLLQQIMAVLCRDTGFELKYDIIEPGGSYVLYEDKSLTVSTFPLYHRIACSGFMFKEKEPRRPLRADMLEFHKVPVAARRSIAEGADFTDAEGAGDSQRMAHQRPRTGGVLRLLLRHNAQSRRGALCGRSALPVPRSHLRRRAGFQSGCTRTLHSA